MTTPQLKCHPHSQRPFKGTGGLYRASTTAEAANATHSAHSDQANQVAVRGLITLTPRPCSLAPSVTTPLYSTTVSQALRQPLRAGVPREYPPVPATHEDMVASRMWRGDTSHLISFSIDGEYRSNTL